MSERQRRPAAAARGRPALDRRARGLLLRFERERGFTRDWHLHLVRHDPEFFARYIGWSSHMYRQGALPLKTKELILMALDAACTHQHEAGTRVHMRNALREGATVAEVVETLELCTLVGIHSCTLGLPILEELLREPAAGVGVGRRDVRRTRARRTGRRVPRARGRRKARRD